MDYQYPVVLLKKGEEDRIRRGEFWVYDNEIAGKLNSFKAGDLVTVLTHDHRPLAVGYINPRSKITIRVLSDDPAATIDRDFFARRIAAADRQRLALNRGNCNYRMVYGEADLLPGLVIDRFADHLIIQITSAGIECRKEWIFDILLEMYPRAVLVEKSISFAREKEGLPEINRLVTPGACSGTVAEINGLRFQLDFLKSQKTGFFLDQQENYRLLQEISSGREILDVFSYAGAWGLHAFHYGARRVTFIEISTEYLAQTRTNIELNDFPAAAFSLLREDAVKSLKEMSRQDKKWDLVILDPPAFVKSRNKVREALRGYKEINLRALKMITPGGFLLTCSCSHFLSRQDFIGVIESAAFDAGRRVKLLRYNAQPPDHAVLLPLWQSDYLKCALCWVY